MDDILKLIQNQKWDKLKSVYNITEAQGKKLFNMIKPLKSGASSSTIKDVSSSIIKQFGGLTGKVAGGITLLLASIKGLTNATAKGIDNFAKGAEGEIEESLGKLTNLGGNFFNNLKNFNLFTAASDLIQAPVDLLTQGMANAYGAEIKARETVNKELNITGQLGAAYRDTVVDAYKNSILLGGTFSDIHEIVNGIGNTLGVSKMLGSEIVSDIYATQKALGVDNNFIAAAAGSFEDVSIGISSVSKHLDKAGANARGAGLKVNDYVKKVTENLTLVNQYGFKNGVKGLEEMLRKSQALRINMADITAVADKVWNPEGALEMAANLQAIGGAFGSFADPMKLVYQATNDMEGLQDSVIGAAKSLAHFNHETGKFELSALDKRRAKDMADAIGYPVKEFENLAIRAAQKGKILQELNFAGNFEDKDKEFLSNISELKDGKIQIDMAMRENQMEEFMRVNADAVVNGSIIVSKLNEGGIKKLQEVMDEKNKESQNPIEIANQQLSELQAIEFVLKQIATNSGIAVNRSQVAKKFKNDIRVSGQGQKDYAQRGDAAMKEIAKLISDKGLTLDLPGEMFKIIKKYVDQQPATKQDKKVVTPSTGTKGKKDNKVTPEKNENPFEKIKKFVTDNIPLLSVNDKPNQKPIITTVTNIQPVKKEVEKEVKIAKQEINKTIQPSQIINNDNKTITNNSNELVKHTPNNNTKKDDGEAVTKNQKEPIKSEIKEEVLKTKTIVNEKHSFVAKAIQPIDNKNDTADKMMRGAMVRQLKDADTPSKETQTDKTIPTKSEVVHTVKININGDTAFDGLKRTILSDHAFIHELKQAIKEQNYS